MCILEFFIMNQESLSISKPQQGSCAPEKCTASDPNESIKFTSSTV